MREITVESDFSTSTALASGKDSDSLRQKHEEEIERYCDRLLQSLTDEELAR